MTVPARIGPMDIPGNLLEKYNTRGPRYTSYPTAPQFKQEFSATDVEDCWKRTADSDEISLYTHIPFCHTRCLYCGCTTETGHSRETIDRYINTLDNELRHLSRLFTQTRTIRQMALGGGTPTTLSPDAMTHLIRMIKSHFNLSTDIEQSIEIDPRRMDPGYLDRLIQLGFNRFSFGVQDFNKTVQKNIGRETSFQRVHQFVNHLRSHCYRSINLDLMYGLPGQSETSFSETLKNVLTIRPSRLAVFGYAHVPWVSPHQKALDAMDLPSPDLRTRLFGLAYEILTGAGYEMIGMDHFALPTDSLAVAFKNRTLTRNFMGYTTHRGLDLLGIGASSISGMGSTYTQNVKTVADYLATDPFPAWWKALILTREDHLRRDVILELFCNLYLDFAPIEARYGIDINHHFAEEFNRLNEKADDGLVVFGPDYLRVTDLGRFFIRNICMVFDQYLKSGTSHGTYSKTV